MKRIIILLLPFLAACSVQKPNKLIVKSDISRIVEVLSADDMEGRASFSLGITRAADFIASEFKKAGLTYFNGNSYRQTFTDKQGRELFNVIGILKGKTKPEESIIFSSHYDHIGIIKPVGKDSIANGADDDASGVAAVISLANAYAKLNNNERTLIFIAFTAEEIGGFGSQHFTKGINADSVIAMINFEMIGKDSKFGPKSVFITGFEKSNLGTLMQARVKNTGFQFYPDPYPEQKLFYRSDNATLAKLGVPAHSFSTVQIPIDKLYHTVKDEFESLDMDNIVSTVQAVLIGAEGLVDGTETPTRVQEKEIPERRK